MSAPPTAHDRESGDAELLDAFLVHADRDALEVLISRHAPTVAGVCQRVLGPSADADDAFQATFLVLLEHGRKIRRKTSLASWLYGVAYRVSQRLRRQRPRNTETLYVNELAMPDDDPFLRLSVLHDREIVERELNALPERWRAPLVLRYFVGLTNAEAAAALSLTTVAFEGRLKRARTRIRMRLIRQGITLSAALMVCDFLRNQPPPSCWQPLVQSTVDACQAWRAVNSGHNASPSTHASLLAREELRAMTYNKMTTTLACTASVVFALACGLGIARGFDHPQGGGASDTRLKDKPSTELVLEAFPNAQSSLSPQPTITLAVHAEGSPADDDPFGATGDDATGTPEDNPFGEVSRALSVDGDAAESPSVATSDAGATGTTSAESATPTTQSSVRGTWDNQRRSAKDLAIEQALEEPTTLDFFQSTLPDITDYLSRQHGITFLIDVAALEDEGFDLSNRVDFQLDGVALDNSLALLMERLGLDYLHYRETVYITTPQRALDIMETRFYPSAQSRENLDQTLAPAILRTIAPETWDEQGGLGTLVVVDGGFIVANNWHVHRQIHDLLEQMH